MAIGSLAIIHSSQIFQLVEEMIYIVKPFKMIFRGISIAGIICFYPNLTSNIK